MNYSRFDKRLPWIACGMALVLTGLLFPESAYLRWTDAQLPDGGLGRNHGGARGARRPRAR